VRFTAGTALGQGSVPLCWLLESHFSGRSLRETKDNGSVMYDLVFLIAAAVCVVSAIFIVSQKNPVYSVVYMLPFFLGMTTIFVLLSATFLAAIQMIVYGGAILVVFLFVIMLINLRPEELRDDFSLWPFLFATIGVGAFAGITMRLIRGGSTSAMEAAFANPQLEIKHGVGEGALTTSFGSIQDIAMPLFKQHLVPFELASVLIVVAILGAVMLSKKKVGG